MTNNKSQATNNKQYQNNNNKIINIFKHWSLNIVICLLFVICLLGFASPVHAATISSNKLIDNAKQFDGRVVEYQGEVIGDIMVRQDYAWVNINDGQKAIGIWTPAKLTKEIKLVGSYRHIGDTIKVTGIFNRACADHGGDLDIHAQTIKLVAKGHKIEHPIQSIKIVFIVVLIIGSILLLILPKLKKKKKISF